MQKAKSLLALGLILGALAPTGASAEDRHVRIINETSHTMTRFYASNVEKGSWEEDILGNRVLKPGQSVNVNIDDGSGHCLYDFRADFTDGDTLTRNRINVCETSSYRYTE
jgi:hypothetical protein